MQLKKCVYLYNMRCLFGVLILFWLSTNYSVAQQNEFSLQYQHLKKNKQPANEVTPQKPKVIKPVSVQLFKRMPNHFKTENKLPVFCELEHQLSKAIKKNVKFGVAP